MEGKWTLVVASGGLHNSKIPAATSRPCPLETRKLRILNVFFTTQRFRKLRILNVFFFLRKLRILNVVFKNATSRSQTPVD